MSNQVWVLIEYDPYKASTEMNLGSPYWFRTRERAEAFSALRAKVYPHLPFLKPVCFTFFDDVVDLLDGCRSWGSTDVPRGSPTMMVIMKHGYGLRACRYNVQWMNGDSEDMRPYWTVALQHHP